MRRDTLRTTVVLGGTLASAVLVSLAGAARAPDVDAPLPPPPQTAMEAEGMGLFAAAVDKGDNDDAAADGIVALYASSRAELRSALGGRRLPPPRWCLVVDLRLGLAFFFCSDAFLVLLVLVGAGVIECVGRCPCGWTGADQSSDCWRVFCLLGCSPWP